MSEVRTMNQDYLKDHPKMKLYGLRVYRYVEQNYDRNLTLEDVASYFHLNKCYFCSVLKKELCSYASLNPIETVACDFSKRIIKSLDKNSLLPQYNFIDKSPYRRRTPVDIFKKEKNMEKTLRNFWNGKFNV